MLSHSNWAGLDVENICSYIKITVNKARFVNLNLSEMVFVKFCKFEIKLKFTGYVFCNDFLLFKIGLVVPDMKRTSNHCDTV
jgi:hypothetical protein